jgi:hypothetical protein
MLLIVLKGLLITRFVLILIMLNKGLAYKILIKDLIKG